MIQKDKFENLFHVHFAPLCSIANTIVKDEDTAKDIVQFVFINLWNKREVIKINTSEKAYLHKSVINTSLNYLKKNKRFLNKVDPEKIDNEYVNDDTNEQISFNEVNKNITSAIEALPPKCQAVFSLSRFNGLKNEEIAAELEISLKAVEKHITKALKHLREKLQPFLKKEMVAIFFTIFSVFFRN